MILSASQIRKSYGKQVVLDGVDLTLEQGTITGLLGRNGAGKSTLLKIISGINKPDQGKVEIKDLDIAYMSERNPLYPHMYVTEYLSWIADIKLVDDKGARLNWVVKQAGLEEVRGKKISQLSKGFRQRVGLAATLISDPDVIILDEPINGLDPVQIKEYRSLIKTLSSDKIVILSSHLLQEIEAICDEVLLIQDGQISRHKMSQENPDQAYEVRLSLDKSMDTQVLQDLEGVMSVDKRGATDYLIEVASSHDIRLEICDVVIAEGCRIKELSRRNKGLQEIFDN